MMRRLAILAALAIAAPAAAQTAPTAAEAPVLARPIQKGERLGVADFVVEAVSPALARAALLPEHAAGMEAVRNLRAGAIVRSYDIAPAQLVRRGEPVAIMVRSGALAIRAQGRALSGGAAGDLVRVVTDGSRTLEGVVEKAGEVRIAAH